ncbi:hypothetical protein Ae201684_007434 [Aphanomyces euteiches]|uniref:C1q domain-containing protein n=1 Tax=Aphanomyces euteiches TaxID=100861 RepID=A0A6G0X8L3_9STRA|nr:hypothetical protein Ae201684_007434 [Aphanomyces euteiches]
MQPGGGGLVGLTHLLAGESEWRNIQTIVKTTLQAIAKIVSNHAIMLETIDSRIDRIQDTLRMPTKDLETSAAVSRQEFLALVANVRKIQKKCVTQEDVEARVVACGEQLKRRLDHTIGPLTDAIQEMQEAATTNVVEQANNVFASKDNVPTNDVLQIKLSKVEQTIAALDRRISKAQGRHHQEALSQIESGVRSHIADQAASTRDEMSKLQRHIDEALATMASEWHVQLRQRAMASDVKLVLESKLGRDDFSKKEVALSFQVYRINPQQKQLMERLEASQAAWQHDVATSLQKKCAKADVIKLLSRKVNREEMDASLGEKVQELHTWVEQATTTWQDDLTQQLTRMQDMLQCKLRDHGDKIAQHLRDIQCDQRKEVDDWTTAMEELRAKLAIKMGIKDACTLLDTKCNVSDVNEALAALQETISAKTDDSDFKALVDDVDCLRRQMRGELCVGRWIWKNGRPTPRQTVCWSVQVVNTNPDIFAWEKGSDTITALVPGLYQLQASFFTDYNPTIQIAINGEPALVISSGEKADSRRRRHSAGNVTGITICEFLALPPRATVTVTYDIDERAQGFLTLRKL